MFGIHLAKNKFRKQENYEFSHVISEQLQSAAGCGILKSINGI